MVPVRVEILPPEKDGSQGVAVGETERIYGTKWTVIVRLRPGRSYLEERVSHLQPHRDGPPVLLLELPRDAEYARVPVHLPSMTLGCDHSGETFFKWPIDHGKDLTWGTNYFDASSIFAWYCDQDFFGSYCEDLGRGVVSCANHHEVPGKKAWTWGQGGFGKMHQMDLTDHDGPYNEVQTGPLLTQGQVGRLEPCQAVEWNEWWYPIHGIGGFTFANNNLAVNETSAENGQVRLRLLGTATWADATVKLAKGGRQLDAARCQVSPRQPTEVRLATHGENEPFDVEITAAGLQTRRFPPAAGPAGSPAAREESQAAAERLRTRARRLAGLPVSTLGRSRAPNTGMGIRVRLTYTRWTRTVGRPRRFSRSSARGTCWYGSTITQWTKIFVLHVTFAYSWLSKFRTILQSRGIAGSMRLLREALNLKHGDE